MKKVLIFSAGLVCILLIILAYHFISKPSLKDRMIEELHWEEVLTPYPKNDAQRKMIANSKIYIERIQKMKTIEPPFVLLSVRYAIRNDSEDDSTGWTFGWLEDGFAAKGFRIRTTPQINSAILVEVPFPEDIWDWVKELKLKKSVRRYFSFKMVHGEKVEWLDYDLLSLPLSIDTFRSSVYISLYDSKGKECEPILCNEYKKTEQESEIESNSR
ncbi:MAG: hypothetical protein NTX52_05330 [Planctomycetota bacterium]|nr:hypothetical protein [Planctomycetota bacterium]